MGLEEGGWENRKEVKGRGEFMVWASEEVAQ
jgi:hypothetical protein